MFAVESFLQKLRFQPDTLPDVSRLDNLKASVFRNRVSRGRWNRAQSWWSCTKSALVIRETLLFTMCHSRFEKASVSRWWESLVRVRQLSRVRLVACTASGQARCRSMGLHCKRLHVSARQKHDWAFNMFSRIPMVHSTHDAPLASPSRAHWPLQVNQKPTHNVQSWKC